MILAQDQAGAIGNGTSLPWPRIKKDMQFFQQATTGHVVIMGRKTFETLGAPLKDRTNIVLTTNPNWKADGVEVVHDLKRALNEYTELGEEEIFIIGGADVYNHALRYADRILLTRVFGTFEADVFFRFNVDDWILDSSEQYREDDQLICTFESYIRPKEEEPEEVKETAEASAS
jgi:dihydrofolate reductase